MKNHNLNFLELVETSLKQVDECDIYQVKAMLDGKEDFHLIDVRAVSYTHLTLPTKVRV